MAVSTVSGEGHDFLSSLLASAVAAIPTRRRHHMHGLKHQDANGQQTVITVANPCGVGSIQLGYGQLFSAPKAAFAGHIQQIEGQVFEHFTRLLPEGFLHKAALGVASAAGGWWREAGWSSLCSVGFRWWERCACTQPQTSLKPRDSNIP